MLCEALLFLPYLFHLGFNISQSVPKPSKHILNPLIHLTNLGPTILLPYRSLIEFVFVLRCRRSVLTQEHLKFLILS